MVLQLVQFPQVFLNVVPEFPPGILSRGPNGMPRISPVSIVPLGGHKWNSGRNRQSSSIHFGSILLMAAIRPFFHFHCKRPSPHTIRRWRSVSVSPYKRHLSSGIDPGTFRLLAQFLNHYATPRPNIY